MENKELKLGLPGKRHFELGLKSRQPCLQNVAGNVLSRNNAGFLQRISKIKTVHTIFSNRLFERNVVKTGFNKVVRIA